MVETQAEVKVWKGAESFLLGKNEQNKKGKWQETIFLFFLQNPRGYLELFKLFLNISFLFYGESNSSGFLFGLSTHMAKLPFYLLSLSPACFWKPLRGTTDFLRKRPTLAPDTFNLSYIYFD